MKIQIQAMDVLSAYTESKRVLTNLDIMRENSEKEFKIILIKAEVCSERPRITGRQVPRSNILVLE